MTVLIVDDNSANLKLLRAQLEAEGMLVVAAADGRQAQGFGTQTGLPISGPSG